MKKLLFAILFCFGFETIAAQNSLIENDATEKARIPLTYQGEVAAGFGYGFSETNSVLIETVHGFRLNPYLFAGLGAGLNYYDGFGMLTPAFNIKGYYPVTRKIDLYLSFDLGATVGIAD